MKILFLSHYFPPEVNAPASRTFDHCAEWVKSGHEVEVITCAPNHPKGNVYPGYKNKIIQSEVRSNINVTRVWTYLTANEGIAKRTLNYVSFMLSAIFASLFIKKIDVVITTSPQFFNGLAGYFVAKAKRIPWVLEIRDLWPDSIMAVGAMKDGTVIRILKKVEKFIYINCAHIVVVTESFKDYMVQMGIAAEKITVIKNGVDLSLFTVSADSQEYSSNELQQLKEQMRGKFVASYVGTHGMAHHLETVLEAAKLLEHDLRICFLLVGEGAEKNRLLELQESLNLKNVIMLGQQPKEAMPFIWSISHASLVVLKKDDVFKSVIPSKIFESMAMKKPIILGVEGEAASLIEQAKCGVVISPENAEQLAAAVKHLANDPLLFGNYAESGQAYVTAFYDRKSLAAKFITILSELAANNIEPSIEQNT